MVFMDFFKSQKIIFALELLFFSLLAFFIGSPATTSPFYGDLNVIDEGQFAAWGNFMLHGKQLFKDMYVVYGPLYVYPVYILFEMFSPSAFLVRCYLIAGSIVGIIAMNFVMKELKIGILARYIMNLLLIFLPIMFLRQGMGWISLYLLILMATRKKVAYSFLTGLFAALTLLVTPDIGIIIGVIIGLYFMYHLFTHSEWRKISRHLAYWALGYGIPLILFFIWAGAEGWLQAYLFGTIRQLIEFSGMNVPNGQNLPNIFLLMPSGTQFYLGIKFLASEELLIYYVIALHIVLLSYWTIKIILKEFSYNDKKLFPIFLFSISLLYISLRTPDLGHLFFILSPILLLSIYYLEKCFVLIKKKSIRIPLKIPYFVIASIILLLFFRLFYLNHPQIIKTLHIPSAIATTPKNPKYVGPIHISDEQRRYFGNLQNFMENASTPHDKIFIFTDEPMLYLIVNRDNATKYVLPFAAVTKTMREDMVNDLKKNRPKYILINNNAWHIDGISNEKRLPEVVQHIRHNYTKTRVIDGFIIYRHNTYE